MKRLLAISALVMVAACAVPEPICDRDAQLWDKFGTQEDKCDAPIRPSKAAAGTVGNTFSEGDVHSNVRTMHREVGDDDGVDEVPLTSSTSEDFSEQPSTSKPTETPITGIDTPETFTSKFDRVGRYGELSKDEQEQVKEHCGGSDCGGVDFSDFAFR